MLRRISIILISLIFLSMTVVSAQAAKAEWTAWLNYGLRMVEVDSLGNTLHDEVLPVALERKRYAFWDHSPVVSHSGQYAAYGLTALRDTTPFHIVLYNLNENRVAFSSALPETAYFPSSDMEWVFNDTDTRLAISTTSGLASEWTIQVLDVTDGHISNVLDSKAPLLKDWGNGTLGLWFKGVQYYKGNEIIFTLEWDSTNPIQRKLFKWNIADGTIREIFTFDYPYISHFSYTTFPPTGESLSIFQDTYLPSNPSNDPNSIRVYDPVVGVIYPFYKGPVFYWSALYFVQNGERVLFQSDEAWTLIGRDGAIIGEWTPPENLVVGDVHSTPDGFIFGLKKVLFGRPGCFRGTPTLFEANTRNPIHGSHAIWTVPINEQSVFNQRCSPSLAILWVGSDMPVGPFIPWAQLADPIYEPGRNTFFVIGKPATVHTTAGNQLNVHVWPGLDTKVTGMLRNGERVTIMEGPFQADGYTWWRIRSTSGLGGWAVERVDDNGVPLQTLLPG